MDTSVYSFSVAPGRADEYAPVDDMLAEENFTPSRQISRATIGMRVTSSSQPARMVLPQLIPDGLSPSDHLKAALICIHPFQRDPTVHLPVRHALRRSPSDPARCNAIRFRVTELIRELAAAVKDENEILLSLLHTDVTKVLTSVDYRLGSYEGVIVYLQPQRLGSSRLPCYGPSDDRPFRCRWWYARSERCAGVLS